MRQDRERDKVSEMKKAIQIMCVLALMGPLASEGRGDFTLRNDDQLTVDSAHTQGTLYDESHAELVPGGSVTDTLKVYNTSTVDVSGGWVKTLEAYDASAVSLSQGWVSGPTGGYFVVRDASTVNVSGGYVRRLSASQSSTVNVSGGEVGRQGGDYLSASGASTVNISGGAVYSVSASGVSASGASTVNMSGGSIGSYLSASQDSTVNISGGSVERFDAYGASIVNISGAWVYDLRVYDTCSMTLIAREFSLGDGLSLEGDRVMGTGSLIAESFDGTHWLLNITRNDSGATILATPEPATLSLLALGGLAVLRRRSPGRRRLLRRRKRGV